MTVHAHNANRGIGSASRKRGFARSTSAPTQMLKELHPELYKEIPHAARPAPEPVRQQPLRTKRRLPMREKQPISQLVRTYLETNLPATPAQIAQATGLNVQAVRSRLCAGIAGVVRVGAERSDRGRHIAIWGLDNGA